MNNRTAWREDDEIVHILDDYRNGDFTDMTTHTEEMIALLEANGLTAESWVYGSYCRPLSGTWCRIEGVTIIQNETGNQPYSYAVTPTRMARADVDGDELALVSRPERQQ